MKSNKLKLYNLDELTDEFIGKPGTPKRDAFEYELRPVIGNMSFSYSRCNKKKFFLSLYRLE